MKRILSQFLLLLSCNVFAQVGIGTTAPVSTLDVNGSFSADVSTTSGNLTLDDTHHTIVLGGNHNITLPVANTCDGRIYVIKNPTTNTPTISSYNDLNGTATTTLQSQTTIWVQSDGTNWEQIGKNKIAYEKVVIWAEEAGNIGNNNMQWSYGNGDAGFIGIPLPESWEAYAVSFHADNTSNASNTLIVAVVDISGNGAFTEFFRFTASGANDNMSYTEILATPVAIPSGTTLGFRSITESGNINSARVAVWLRRIP
ncbi:hypothetical protein H7U19_14830 [Hyunsoonleella sp. SJ7]|uniref:Cleaved adhesin domain-containing protein n=1 Tax=Hyunsoonleella aquatilis TaxID=2762758 RepID=A0A923HEI0_9FLAO|nr:hypothetical protein [Hyunsoonleella aquatilis]MBC3759686.1 hypothetical protein [Hyunsoonleella aquatilis]